jgi:hypothetical protein
METFYKKIDELKKRPWYDEARKTHLNEIKSKNRLERIKKEKEKLQKEYEEKIGKLDQDFADETKRYEDAQITHRWKIELENTEESDPIDVNDEEIKKQKLEELFWNKDAILDDLIQNHVKIEENYEYLSWYEWKKISIKLPAVWNFEWFEFNCFAWDESLRRNEFEHFFYKDKSYSMHEICELLRAINRYMKELWVETDWDMNYFNDLKHMWWWRIERGWNNCIAWKYLREITGLNDVKHFWLLDSKINWRENTYVQWALDETSCCFSVKNGGLGRWKLLLKELD